MPEAAVTMPEICEKCGDKGYSELLIYCSRCKVSCEHRYCLDKLPERDVLEVLWSCEQCEPRKSSSFNRLGLRPSRTSECLTNRKRKKTTDSSKDEIHVRNYDTTLQSHEVCFKGDTQMNDNVPDPAEVATDSFPCKENYIQRYSNGNSEESMKSKKRRRKSILHDEGSSDEDTESAKDRNSPVTPDIRNAPFDLSSHEISPGYRCYGPAQPIIDPVWRGCFSICNEKSGKVVGTVAHLSNKACSKVFEGANALPVLLGVEMLPRLNAWPKSFRISLPTDDNIGLYFFPGSRRDEAVFDGLLHEIIDRDLTLKFVTDNAELLIFSSLHLPPLFHRFHGKYYLWGVFRGKQVSHPPKPFDHLLIKESSIKCDMPSISAGNFGSQKGREPIKTWSQRSPLSPLSMRSSYGTWRSSMHMERESNMHMKKRKNRMNMKRRKIRMNIKGR
ncbi:uncharacterized protein LOC122057774 isoform X2 [Macadamia integrifolia]|uniref:uncharacterized protein LOC122057774 isoform X2 n=1 Tax=Macadamia integrifolia TaxID=60698 RepID=UPI001C4F8E61|nr:uncharacterized protein LOC122057774 isoform X2 [Macadamia integrifolia]